MLNWTIIGKGMNTSGNEVPERLRHLTLAHELAHSLGSNHDHSLLENGVDRESKLYPECDYDKKNVSKDVVNSINIHDLRVTS